MSTVSKLVNLRKSSSLIISSTFGKNLSNNNEDYKVILLKRSLKMKSWPSYYVYPGGRIDLIDESIKWLSLLLTNKQQNEFEKNSDSSSYLKEIFKSFINNNSIGKYFNNNNTNDENKLPSEISFRLCAIRECFEETGLLLAHDKSLVNSDYYKQSNLFTNCYDKNLDQILKWHKIIKEKPDEFINLFQDLNLVPDLNG
jgi:nucleoside diphosphate-linked moiety X motif protein 19